MISLNEAVCGSTYEIKWLLGIAENLRMRVGDTLDIIQNAGGDMIVKHKYRRLALSRDICSKIKVGEHYD